MIGLNKFVHTFLLKFKKRRHLQMKQMNQFFELVDECKWKLDRNLTKQELELIMWIQERKLEALFEDAKPS